MSGDSKIDNANYTTPPNPSRHSIRVDLEVEMEKSFAEFIAILPEAFEFFDRSNGLELAVFSKICRISNARSQEILSNNLWPSIASSFSRSFELIISRFVLVESRDESKPITCGDAVDHFSRECFLESINRKIKANDLKTKIVDSIVNRWAMSTARWEYSAHFLDHAIVERLWYPGYQKRYNCDILTRLVFDRATLTLHWDNCKAPLSQYAPQFYLDCIKQVLSQST